MSEEPYIAAAGQLTVGDLQQLAQQRVLIRDLLVPRAVPRLLLEGSRQDGSNELVNRALLRVDLVVPELGERPGVLVAAALRGGELRVVEGRRELVCGWLARLHAGDVGRGRVREAGGERADVGAEEELGRGVEGEA